MTKHFKTLKHNIWLPYQYAVGPVFNRFYEGLKEEKIWANQCPACSKMLVPPRSFCPHCSVDMGEWVEAAQEGKIVTWMTANEPFFGQPVQPPLIGALIHLDGTDCNFLHLVGGLDLNDSAALKEKIKAGTRVRAVWRAEKKGEMLDIMYFQPIS